MKITIFGIGYVGLTAGCCFADAGNNVLCYDNDVGKVNSLKERGEPFFYEHGLNDMFSKNAKNKHLIFTSDFNEAINWLKIFYNV